MSSASPNHGEGIPRPPTVKRDTSHKLETLDIEPTTKRMNRQTSIGRVNEITEKDIRHLNSSLEQSSIVGNTNNDEGSTLDMPKSLTESDRMSTIDRFLIDIDGPSSL